MRKLGKIFTALALAATLAGCGSSFEEQISGQPVAPAPNPPVTDPIVDILADGVDESLEGAPPLAASQFQLTFSGSSNASTTSFSKGPSSAIIAALQPNPSAPTALRLNILNKSTANAVAYPFLDLQFGLGNSATLRPGTRLSADTDSAGPRAQLVYGEKFATPILKLFTSRSGTITLTELNTTAGARTARLKFDRVVMVPRAAPGNTATGSFTINGEASVSF